MGAIAVTGAAGEVGREALDAFDRDELSLFTHHEHEDLHSQTLEVTDREAFVEALSGHDVLLHFAWAPAPRQEWTGAHVQNIRGTHNAYEAARRNDLDRVVFASSVHVTGMYNRDTPGDMESLAPDPDRVVTPEDPPRPDSYYGVAKMACEGLGSYYADRYGVEAVSLRIGWLMPRSELRETCAETGPTRRFARATWLSPRDLRAAVGAAAEQPLATTPLVVNAVSRNDDRYLTLTGGAMHLGYEPRDNAAEVLDGG